MSFNGQWKITDTWPKWCWLVSAFLVPGFAPQEPFIPSQNWGPPPTPNLAETGAQPEPGKRGPEGSHHVHPHTRGQLPFPRIPGPRIGQGCPQSAFPARPPTLGTWSIHGMRTSQDLPNVTNLKVEASKGHPGPRPHRLLAAFRPTPLAFTKLLLGLRGKN